MTMTTDVKREETKASQNGNAPLPSPSRRGGRILAAVIILAGAAVVLAISSHKGEAPGSDQSAVATNTVTVSPLGQSVAQIETTPVKLAALDNNVVATGLVSYPADSQVKVAPRVTGRVDQVFVQVGDHVIAGQPIAVIDSPDAATARTAETQNESSLRLAQLTLMRTEQQYKLGTPEVTAAQAAFDQAKENTDFSRQALEKIKEQSRIGGYSQSPLEAAKNTVVTDQSNVEQAQADLDTAQSAYDRMVKLVGIGVNSQQDLENANDTLAHAKANADASQKVLDLANEALDRETKAYNSNLYTDQALITATGAYQQALLQQEGAARALAIARAAILADLQQAQNGYQTAAAAVQSSQASLALLGNPGPSGEVTVTSPISGVVTERDVNPGQMIDQSQMTPWQLMVIANANSVWVNVDVYENDLAAIHVGEPLTIKVDAYPARDFPGTVTAISPTLNATTRAVSVRAEIPNPEGLLKDGMFAEARIDTGRSAQEPVIPSGALRHDADTEYVFVASGDGIYARQNVRVGEQKNGMATITYGLDPGQKVVTQGALLLDGNVESD